MMKINEKVLMKYATTSSYETDKEGWLFKKSQSKNEFQKRYCLLKGNLFFYFEKKIDKEPLGCIILEGCRLELEDNVDQLFTFKIIFSPKNYKSYVFATDSQESTESWMKALSSSSLSFMRAICSELQKQVEELENEEKNRNSYTKNQDLFSIKQNPFDDENYLTQINGERSNQMIKPKNNSCFSRKPFIEVHQYYGMQFKNFFDERLETNNIVKLKDLILL